jgi:Domain of unknown function DUF29
MPDDLYDRDILIWSEQQADLLRRLGRGEGVNGVDWAHVVAEIEDAGLSELHSVQSYLNLMLAHLLKIHGWPNNQAQVHWQVEVVAFQQNMTRRFTPSMRQKIDVPRLYTDALEQPDGINYDGITPRPWPLTCPFTLDQLLNDRRAVLEDHLGAASPERGSL